MLSIMRTFLLSQDIVWPISLSFKVQASKQRLLLFCCLIDVLCTVQTTECPKLWRITKHSLHNEGIHK